MPIKDGSGGPATSGRVAHDDGSGSATPLIAVFVPGAFRDDVAVTGQPLVAVTGQPLVAATGQMPVAANSLAEHFGVRRRRGLAGTSNWPGHGRRRRATPYRRF